MTPTEIIAKLKEPFPADAISWRVGSTSKDKTKGMALAYIDSRDVQERLDAIVGADNWRDEYQELAGFVVCKLWVRIGGEWIWKCDGAGKTDVEAEKGMLSDSFKRAAVKWGIGRYLYSLDSPWVEINEYRQIAKHEYGRLRQLLTLDAGKRTAPVDEIPHADPKSTPPPAKPAAAPAAKAKAPAQTPAQKTQPEGWKTRERVSESKRIADELLDGKPNTYIGIRAMMGMLRNGGRLDAIEADYQKWYAIAQRQWKRMSVEDQQRVTKERNSLVDAIKDEKAAREPGDETVDPETGEIAA